MVSASLSKMQRIVNHQQAHGLVNYCLVDGTLEMHAGTFAPVKLDRGSTAQPKPEYRPLQSMRKLDPLKVGTFPKPPLLVCLFASVVSSSKLASYAESMSCRQKHMHGPRPVFPFLFGCVFLRFCLSEKSSRWYFQLPPLFNSFHLKTH